MGYTSVRKCILIEIRTLIGLKTDNREPCLPLTLFDLQTWSISMSWFTVCSNGSRVVVGKYGYTLRMTAYLVSRTVIFGIMVVTEKVILIDFGIMVVTEKVILID